MTRTVRTSTGDLRWDVFGDADAGPVVLLHGTPFSSFVWRTVTPVLARNYRVFVWDMPGFGESEKADGQDVSIGAQAQVFAGLLAHWELDAPSVIAHDIGGAVALRAMLVHGARYGRLGLIDVVAVRPWGSPFFRLVRDHADVFEQLPSEMHRALVRAYVVGASSGGLSEAVLDRLIDPWLGRDGQRAFYRQIAQADQRATDDIQDRYPAIDIPVLVGWGTADSWIPLQRGEELAASIPTARFEPIAGAGHLVQEDAPEALTDLIAGFLAREGA